jgi:hypothetical protein
MQIQPNRMVSLGYGKFVRSDDVVGIEPIGEGRGPGRRALVYVRGLPTPLIASRSEEALFNDLVRPASEVSRERFQRSVLARVAKVLDQVPGSYRRRLRESGGIDLDELAEEANKAIA